MYVAMKPFAPVKRIVFKLITLDRYFRPVLSDCEFVLLLHAVNSRSFYVVIWVEKGFLG
mgnify:CR=1 FL=1